MTTIVHLLIIIIITGAGPAGIASKSLGRFCYWVKSFFCVNLLFQKLNAAMTELEELKPAVSEKLEELHYKQIYQLHKQQKSQQSQTLEPSVEWPLVRRNVNDFSRKQV